MIYIFFISIQKTEFLFIYLYYKFMHQGFKKKLSLPKEIVFIINI